MADYKAMYFTLARAIAKSLKLMSDALLETEEAYITARGDDLDNLRPLFPQREAAAPDEE